MRSAACRDLLSRALNFIHLLEAMPPLAGQILQKIAEVLHLPSFVEVTVENDSHLDFSSFDVARHAGVLLDGIGEGRTSIC